MPDLDNPRGWMQAWPDVAALVAGLLALTIRVSNSDGPRSWRVVAADAAGTLAIGYAAYRGAMGVLEDNHNVAFCLAVLTASMGWEWIRRKFGAWAGTKLK